MAEHSTDELSMAWQVYRDHSEDCRCRDCVMVRRELARLRRRDQWRHHNGVPTVDATPPCYIVKADGHIQEPVHNPDGTWTFEGLMANTKYTIHGGVGEPLEARTKPKIDERGYTVNITKTGNPLVDQLRKTLAKIDESGLPPTVNAGIILADVVNILDQADSDYTGRGAPSREYYVDAILSNLADKL